MKDTLDNDTLLAFKRGNEQAFNKVFDRFYNDIRFFATKIIGDPEEAKDVTIRALTTLYHKRDQFSTENNIRGFLFVTARNGCLDILRYRKRVQHRNEEWTTRLEGEELYQESLVQSGVLFKIFKSVEQLPEECKRVFKMYYLEELKSDEIAVRMGINVSTVRSHKSRAIQALRKILADEALALLLLGSLACCRYSPGY